MSNGKKSKQELNRAHRQGPNGWLVHYYGRLKRAGKGITSKLSAQEFSEASRQSKSFVAAWERYAASGFDKKLAPKYENYMSLLSGATSVMYRVDPTPNA